MKSNGGRHPEEILAEMEHTRAQMDETLGAIERRLTPGQLVDQGLNYLRNSGGREFLSNLGTSVRDNPIPVSLVGVGLAWLMMRGNAPRQDVADSGGTVAGRTSAMATAAKEKAAATVGSVRSRYDAARDRAGDLGRSAREQVVRARRGYDRMLDEQPLAVGAIGLAIGAILAAAAPRTRQENRLMGAASDRVTARARDIAQESLKTAGDGAAAASRADANHAQPSSSPHARNEHSVDVTMVSEGSPAAETRQGGHT